MAVELPTRGAWGVVFDGDRLIVGGNPPVHGLIASKGVRRTSSFPTVPYHVPARTRKWCCNLHKSPRNRCTP